MFSLSLSLCYLSIFLNLALVLFVPSHPPLLLPSYKASPSTSPITVTLLPVYRNEDPRDGNISGVDGSDDSDITRALSQISRLARLLKSLKVAQSDD